MKMLKRQAGVTLPELMIALSVLAILISMSAPSYSEFINKRKVAGAANLVAMFFENAKMESVKRHSFASVSYKKADNGTDWCFGAVIGKEVACDCMAETPECLIDSVPVILSNQTFTQFNNLEATFTEGTISYDPIRGILTDPTDSASIEIKHSEEDYLVNISVNATGSIRKCSPDGHELVGYATCI
jgi:prepilin-type N-terminal cleavage/methylation domain-containing protein